ncbi:MAG: hypothetical protein EBU90_18720 [Proteobacteria bacterium]|nr:hypothetical protein [Pseudomonadota bacterium]NBP16237.1 hypothetical protein [bacterium]
MVKRFDEVLQSYLSKLNTGDINYQQYFIVEKNKFFYIFNENKDKIIGSGKTLKEAREKIDTICSGC